MFGILLSIDDDMAENFDLGMLSCEGRMLSLLLVKEKMSVKHLMLNTNVSSRKFFLCLKKMKDAGIFSECSDHEDRRVKNIFVSDWFRSALARNRHQFD